MIGDVKPAQVQFCVTPNIDSGHDAGNNSYWCLAWRSKTNYHHSHSDVDFWLASICFIWSLIFDFITSLKSLTPWTHHHHPKPLPKIYNLNIHIKRCIHIYKYISGLVNCGFQDGLQATAGLGLKFCGLGRYGLGFVAYLQNSIWCFVFFRVQDLEFRASETNHILVQTWTGDWRQFLVWFLIFDLTTKPTTLTPWTHLHCPKPPPKISDLHIQIDIQRGWSNICICIYTYVYTHT